MLKKGYTLTEVLMVVVLLGILGGIAIPNYAKSVEKGKARQAATYLTLIRTGQKLYRANNNTYIACANVAAIKTNLGVDITAENFTFAVTAPTATTFTATATRNTDSTTIILDQDGTWSGNNIYKPSNG